MKTSLKNVELKALIPVTPVAVPKEVEVARQLVSRLDPRKVKQYALIAVGAACGIKLISTVSQKPFLSERRGQTDKKADGAGSGAAGPDLTAEHGTEGTE